MDKQKRLRSLKVIVSEVIMVIAVAVMVVLLAFLVSGYWINSDFEVDRQGLLQLSSLPSGADVTIDGVTGAWYERTNMSKNLVRGEHTIVLSREGYDTWTKTINVSEGLLYRLHYPRLFLQERESESLLEMPENARVTISPDHNSLLIMTPTEEWQVVELNNETVKPVALPIEQLFATVPFEGEVENARWDQDGSHVLIKVKLGETHEWVLVNVENPANSINITKEFGADFSEIEILDNASNNLLVVQNGGLHRIDLGSKSISNVLVPGVMALDHFNENEVVFVAARPAMAGETIEVSADAMTPYYVGTFRIGDSKITELRSLDSAARVTLSKFYEDKYFTILVGDTLTVYKKDGFEQIAEFRISFVPETLKVGHNGEFIMMTAGNQIATLDMEPMQVREWTIETNFYDWIDNDMLYTIKDGELIVYDFDGLNRRVLASGVTENWPAAITDDKWLYYFSNGRLVREWLNQR